MGGATFDKDDDLAVDFVTAASNLRAACYNIPQQSLFDAKGMAGNIIHAIATTNAIIGGLIVVEALKVLAGELSLCSCVLHLVMLHCVSHGVTLQSMSSIPVLSPAVSVYMAFCWSPIEHD